MFADQILSQINASLPEHHAEFVRRLRVALFTRYKLSDYRLVDGSEIVLEAIPAIMHGKTPSFGGLSFEARHPNWSKIELRHARLDNLVIFTFRRCLTTEAVGRAIETSLSRIEYELHRVMNRDECWRRLY